MDEELRPEERQAYEAARPRIEELRRQVDSADENLKAASESDDTKSQARAAQEALRAVDALARASLDAGRWSKTGHQGLTQAEAAQFLLGLRREAGFLVPLAVETLLEMALMESHAPEVSSVREGAREDLLGTGFVTAHELEPFPGTSLKAIILERFRLWDEAN